MILSNTMQRAIIKKDFMTIVSNRRLFPVLLIVPFVLAVLVPSIFIMVIAFVPEELGEFKKMLDLLPQSMQAGGGADAEINKVILDLLLNRIMPIFFLLIPVMAASVMAASSFVGEKEKRTLETLLYCPLSLKQIFEAKIAASFIMSLIVSLSAFVLMIIAVEIEVYLTAGFFIIPDLTWFLTLALLAPSIALTAISLTVRSSAKAQTVEEAQQRAVFLILPLIALLIGQFVGVLLVSTWLLAGLGIVCAVLGVVLLNSAHKQFTYEALLAGT